MVSMRYRRRALRRIGESDSDGPPRVDVPGADEARSGGEFPYAKLADFIERDSSIESVNCIGALPPPAIGGFVRCLNLGCAVAARWAPLPLIAPALVLARRGGL